jgi:hypothetical protein
MNKPQRSKRERDYVEHVQQLRRRSGTDRNKSKYNRKVKHRDREFV